MKPRVLTWSHASPKCGIHQTNLQTEEVLRSIDGIKVLSHYSDSAEDYWNFCRSYHPDCVIVSAMARVQHWWLSQPLYPVPHAWTIHETTPDAWQEILPGPYDPRGHIKLWLSLDPSLQEHSRLRTIGRIINSFDAGPPRCREIPWIGTFGFGFSDKGFMDVARMVAEQFSQATLRLHLAASDYVDPFGAQASQRVTECRSVLQSINPAIQLDVSRLWMSQQDLIAWLGENDLNCLLYDVNKAVGISGGLDWLLAARRPIAINRCPMFRHIPDLQPSPRIEDSDLPSILSGGSSSIEALADQWGCGAARTKLKSIIQELLSLK